MRKNRGFTLIEVMIYVAIFALMISFIAGIVWQVGDSAAANRGRVSLENEAGFVMNKIKWALTGAAAVSQPAVGATGTILAVSKFNFGENPVTISSVAGGVVLGQASGTPVALTSQNVRVTNLIFIHNAEVVSQPESVNVNLSMSASSSDPRVFASTTLTTTFYLRK